MKEFNCFKSFAFKNKFDITIRTKDFVYISNCFYFANLIHFGNS
jgi:hypothetical protein